MKRDDRAVLVIVDIQNDFCPGGALAVPWGDEIVPAVNRLAAEFAHVVLTQDWHPRGHASFASSHAGKSPFDTIDVSYGQQILWPDHCVQGTRGAAFHPDLDVPHAELVLRKGFRTAIDSYSASSRTTVARRPVWWVTLKNADLNALRYAGSPRTFACSIRRSTAASPGSRSRS